MPCSKSEIEKLFVDESYLCTLCGGLCCKGYPGMYLCPERFFSIYPEAQTNFWGALKRYRLTVKKCMGAFIPLPDTVDGRCVFLTSDGCALPKERRPCECRLLVPSEDTVIEGEIHCKPVKGFSYVECFEEWRRFFGGGAGI